MDQVRYDRVTSMDVTPLFRSCFVALPLVLSAACGASGDDDGSSSAGKGQAPGSEVQPPPADVVKNGTITNVVIEVDYASGAEPYTGASGKKSTVNDVWEIARQNLGKLLPGKTVTVPSTLDQMEKLDDISDATYSSEKILAIATAHRNQKNEAGKASYYVVWLNGTFEEDGKENAAVLGVSLGSTGVIAMFKPVIAGASVLPGIDRFVEQSTLVHELGHALGLVNNGIPLTSAHHDAEHGAHCSNEDCVMYWQNEGAAGVVPFVQRYLANDSLILFADDCLNDAAAIHGAAK